MVQWKAKKYIPWYKFDDHIKEHHDVPFTAFYPVFNIVDGTTGNTSVFTGKYQLRIVGGGKKINSIREYDDREIARYNFHDFAE